MNQSIEANIFKNNSHLRIYGGNYTGIAGDVNVHTYAEDMRLKALMDVSSPSAAFNSFQRDPPPRCHPGTCTEILGKITDWINQGISADEPNCDRILWVHGPAGSGKSAIAQTIAEQCISRPEFRIKDAFEESKVACVCATSVNIYCSPDTSKKDVGVFLEAEFKRIRNSSEHRVLMPEATTLWPSKEQIDLVIEKSDGYFIYASVLIQFIDQKDKSPIEALEEVLHGTSRAQNIFGELDKLYYYILSQIPDWSWSPFDSQLLQGINNSIMDNLKNTSVLK
ncbi:hypothetical protein H0H92_003420, partial [Tricholoma furcatifolium]